MDLYIEILSLQTDNLFKNESPIFITDRELLCYQNEMVKIYFSRQLNKMGIPGKIRAILDWCRENDYIMNEEQAYRIAQSSAWELI